MPSPELQATIDSFDYRSYLKMKGLSDEEIPETLSSEAKQKIYSRAYSEYIKNEIKALQAETPGGMSPSAARKEIEERELEESPHLRPLWGYWEKELTAEDVYRPEMLFPILKEKYGIDVTDPDFDIEKLGEKGKIPLDEAINAYIPNIVNKQTHRNVPELEGIKRPEFAKQFRERNALLQGDTVESFLTQYKKTSEAERLAEDEEKRSGLDYWSDLGEQAYIQGRQMLYGNIAGFAQSLVQDPRIPFTNIRWDGASPGTDEGNTLFNRTLLDLAAWGTRKHAEAMRDGEKKDFVPRYLESPPEYLRQGEWGKAGAALMEQMVLNGASTVQNMLTPAVIAFGNRVITPVTGAIGSVIPGVGTATGVALGRGITTASVAGLMVAGGLMTASDVVADLHEYGIYDQSKVDAYLEHIATAVALDSTGTLIDAALMGGGRIFNAIPFIRNRSEAAAKKAALDAATRANGLDPALVNKLAGRQLLRNQSLRRQANAKIWGRGGAGWSVLRRTGLGALQEGWSETQQEAINMDLLNKMTSFDQEGNWNPGLAGFVWPFAWEQANREGGYRFPEKMVRHRLETAGSVGAAMGGIAVGIGSTYNQWQSAKARAALDKANTVTDAQGNSIIIGAAERQREAAKRVFADMQNQGKGVNAATIAGVNLNQVAGVSVANFNGITGTGTDATEAFIDLTMRANAGRENIDDGTLTAVAGGHEVTLANGEKLTFLGTNSEQMLRDLVNLHNSDNHPLTITGGATIEYTPGANKPFKITRTNGVTTNVETLYDNYAFYNFSTNADSSLVMDSILRRTGSQSAESSIGIDITQTGAFSFTGSEQAIRNSINNSNGRLILLDSAKTKKGSTARVRKNGALQSDTMMVLDAEDGVIYTIKLKGGKNNSNAHVNVTARDLGGRRLTLDPDVAKQTIRSAADPSALRNQIRLKSPKAGIIIQGEQVAGSPLWHFKADQIDEIARRTGASVLRNTSNYVEFQLPGYRWTADGRMEEFGTSFALRLDDQGKVWADSMGTSIEIEGINDYQSITPGETNLYAHALQGGKYTTASIDQNTGAITMRRTAPSGAEVEVVLGRRGTIDSYRIVENNAQQLQNMIDAAIAARNARTAQQQATQQGMGQIVDPDLTTYTSQEIAAAGFDPLTINQRLKAVLHAQIAGHIWSPISTFEGIRNIIQAEFGFPMNRLMVRQAVSETGTVNGWSIRNINDEEIGFFNNDTQGLRDFKAFMTDDVINDMFTLDRLTPYLLEQLMNNPQRAIFDLTGVEYKAAVNKFFAYHDAVFRPQTDTSQMTRSTDRRLQVQKSVHIQIDEVINGRVVLPDIAAVRAFYGDLIEQGYGVWDKVSKKFIEDRTTGKRQYGDRAYAQALVGTNPQLAIRYLYKLGNEYYTENELVKAAHDKKNFDLLTDDVINDMIEKRLQGMQERPLDVAARGNRRYIDILNETIFREVRTLLDARYDSIDELINYYGGNLVRRQTFRVHTAQGYMYVGKDDQLYSVQQVQNDPSIQELVTFDSTQYPSQYWTGMGARKYADIYQLRNEDGSLLLNEHVNLRTTDGRSAVPQATVDANLKRVTDRLRGKDILIQYFNTFATNDSINDQIIDEDNEPEIPAPDRSQIETDVRNRLKSDAANAQTIMDFFEIYGHQVQERFAVLDTSNGLYAGRTGNSTMLGVDTFLTQSELAEYIQKNGLNQNQTILEYYVFYNNDLSVIHSFNTMSQEDSFMNELRRPDKVDLIDITKLVDDEFQAEEARVGQQKAKREALRNQRAALASGAARQAATGGGPTPPSTGPIGYADYLTRLFGANSFVNLNAKVELFDGNLTGIMDVPIEDFYWEQNMVNPQGEQVRDVNDPARSLDGELNGSVGKLWRDAKRRGLIEVHKTVVEFLNTQPAMRDRELERIVRGMLGVELQKPQPQVTQAEIQARINSLSIDEQNELLRKHFTPQGYYEVVQNPQNNRSTGRIHFIEENIPWGMGDRVFYHEVGVHASLFLQGEIAERWRTIIQYLKDHEKDDTDLGKAVRAIIRNRGNMGQKKGTFGYWEEVSAYFVADNLNKVSFAARIKAMFRDWFRLSGIVSSRGDITTADIVRFARASTEVAISRSNQLKAQRARGMEASATFSMMGASFHTDTETVRDQYEAVRQHYDNAHYSHMFGMVHDKLTGLPNYSNLDGTHWVLVRTPVFKKWFGDWETRALNASKIVDTAGEPLLVFHNTKYDHEAYDEPFIGLNGNFGHSGQSIYGGMTENPYAEKFRGNTVAQTFVNMRRPLHMHNYEETARYMEALGYERSARRLDLRKLAGSVRNDPRLRAILKGIEDYAADPQPGTSFADFMLLNDNLIYEGVPLTNTEEAHRFLNGLFEAATTPANSTLTNEPVLNANTVEEWQETLDDEETRAHWRQAADIFETRLKPYENQMLRLAYNPDGYFTYYRQAHDDLSVSTRERVKDVLSAVDQRYYGFGERDMIEFRQALMDTYAEISQLPESDLSNDELFVGMVNMSMHNLRMDELHWRLGEDLDFVTSPAYPVPTAQSLLKEHNREFAVSLKSAMMRDGYDGILGTEDILVMHPDQSKDVLEFKRLYPEKSYNPTRGLAENPIENRVVELLNDDIKRDAKALGVSAVRLRSEYRSIYRAFREQNPWSESNLDEYQWILTRTPSFKENFGDWQNDAVRDMVLDTNGEPLRTAQGFIHGTGIVDVGENNYFSMRSLNPVTQTATDEELVNYIQEAEQENLDENRFDGFESFDDFVGYFSILVDTDGLLYEINANYGTDFVGLGEYTKKGNIRKIQLAERMKRATDIGELRRFLEPFVRFWYEKLRNVELTIPDENVRNQIVQLTLTSPQTMKTIARRTGIEYQDDPYKYSSEDLDKLRSPILQHIKDERNELLDSWKDGIDKISTKEEIVNGETTLTKLTEYEYLAWRSLYNHFDEQHGTSLPVDFLDWAAEDAFLQVRNNPKFIDFYTAYVKTIITDVADKSDSTIEIIDENGNRVGRWLRVAKGSESPDTVKGAVSRCRAASFNTGWCTRSTGANEIIERRDRDFWILYSEKRNSAVLAIVPVRMDEDILTLNTDTFYSGIFNLDNPGTNDVPIDLREDVKTLYERTNNEEMKRTLEALRDNWTTREEIAGLERQKIERLKEYLQTHDILDESILESIKEFTGISVKHKIENGESTFNLDALNSRMFEVIEDEELKTLVKEILFNSIDYVKYSIELENENDIVFPRLERVGGTIKLGNNIVLPSLVHVGGGFNVGNNVNAEKLQLVMGYISTKMSPILPNLLFVSGNVYIDDSQLEHVNQEFVKEYILPPELRGMLYINRFNLDTFNRIMGTDLYVNEEGSVTINGFNVGELRTKYPNLTIAAHRLLDKSIEHIEGDVTMAAGDYDLLRTIKGNAKINTRLSKINKLSLVDGDLEIYNDDKDMMRSDPQLNIMRVTGNLTINSNVRMLGLKSVGEDIIINDTDRADLRGLLYLGGDIISDERSKPGTDLNPRINKNMGKERALQAGRYEEEMMFHTSNYNVRPGGERESYGFYFSMFGREGAARLLRTSRYELEAQAEMLEAMGNDPNIILLATGYRRDKDGHWRYEVNNIEHNLQGVFTEPNRVFEYDDEFLLNDVFRAKELYAGYPELANVKVGFEEGMGEGIAYYMPYERKIYLGLHHSRKFQNPEEIRNTLLHEIQHYIQEEEGLPGGTSALTLDHNLYKRDEYKEILKYEKIINDADTPKEFEDRRRQFLPKIEALYKKLTGVENITSLSDIYDASTGENEANAVIARANLTQEELLRRPFEMDMRVTPENQIDTDLFTPSYFSMTSRQMQPSVSPEQRNFEETKGYFSMLADFDPFTQGVIKTYEKDKGPDGRSLTQLMNDAKTPDDFRVALKEWVDAAYKKLSSLEVKASKNNIRNVVATLIVQDPQEMRAMWNRVINESRERDEWLPYEENIDNYTDEQLDALTSTVNEYLTNRRFGLFTGWYTQLNKYFPDNSAAQYLVWRSLYNNFKKRNASSMPVQAIERYLQPAFDRFKNTWRTRPNFYEVYSQVIMDDLIQNASNLIQINDENGNPAKVWIKIAHDSENALDHVIVASMNTNWCTNGQGGEIVVIQDNKHDFWVLYDLNLRESVLAFVPVKNSEEFHLTNGRLQWYTGIFNRENPRDNYVPEPLKNDVRTLFNGVRDIDVRRTLKLLGEKWMNATELKETNKILRDYKYNRFIEYITLHEVLDEDILPIFREITNIDLIINDEGQKVLVGNADYDMFNNLIDVFSEEDSNIRSRVLDAFTNTIQIITGNLHYNGESNFGALTSVDGNVILDGKITLPHLQFVGGNLSITSLDARVPELTRIGGTAYISDSIEIHPTLREYINANRSQTQYRLPGTTSISDEELRSELDAFFELPEEPPENNNFFSMSFMTPRGTQKQADVQYPDASQEILGYFSLTEKRRARYRGDLERAAQEEREGKLQLLKRVRPDLTRGFIESVLDELERYGQDADKEKMVLHWTIRGRIIPYVDRDLIDEARAIVKQKKMPIEKVLTYESPMALIDEYKRDQYKPSEEPIDPESVPEIKKDTKIDHGDGIVSYEIQDDKQGQEAMRRIVNSHFGKKWSKWCLLYANMSGELTDHSWEMWQNYSGLPKRVAFKDGRLISFMGVTRSQTGIYSIDQIINELHSIIEEDVEDDIDVAMTRYNITQDEADLISETNDLNDLFIEINRFVTFIMSLGDKDNYSNEYMYFDMIIDSLVSLINSNYFNDNISNIRSRYPEIEHILNRFGEINVNTSEWDAGRVDDYFKLLEFENPNMIERWKDFANYFRTGFRTMLDGKRSDVRRIIDHIYYVDEDDDLAVIRDRDGELVDLTELNYNVENEFHYQDGEFISKGNNAKEEWYDKNDHSHPNLDWARDDRTLTRIDMGIAVELIQQMNEDEDLIGQDQDDQEWFSMMRRRGVTNYDTDIYDRTEIVGSNGAYKLKNGKIFIDVNQVGQENVARVLLYALVRENQDALNNPVMGRMLSFIQAWEHSQDPRLRGLYADIRMDMMNDHVPDTALLAYAVRRMMADGVNPTNPQAEDTPEGVFAGIIGEVPNIIGQVGGVSTSQVNTTTADIVTVVNAISGVENVPIDVAVPSMGLTEAQMQAAYTRPVPFMDAVMAEVKEIVDRYDGASFDYIDGKPHLILGGQGGMVLNLSENPLFAKNVVDQLMEKLTDFGNFDTMTTDPNAKPGDPGNPFTEIIQKIGTNSQLGTQATEADVNKFINENLPAYIADRIQVIYNETDEYKALFGDTYGALYRPVTADRKVIFVRAYGRNLSDVIGSIVNMTSYFGWTQYNNADFAPLMDELWTVLKHNIQNDLPTYYAKLNGQTPTSSQKSALISAYLAAKSTSIYELAEFAKTSNVAPGDEQRMLDIAKKVKDEITKVELSMAASFARDFGVNKEAVQEYTEKLLRMTMAPFYGKGIWFAYDVDYDTYYANNPNTADRYRDFGHVMVFANDFGPVYKSVPFSEDALTNKIMLQKYRQVKPVWKNFHLFLWRNWHPPMKNIGETILGIQNTIALNRAYRAVTTEFGSALKTIVQDIQAFDDAMIRKGIDVEEFDRAKGYVQELKDRGITDRKLLEQAEVLDIFLRVGREKMLTNVTDIRALIRDSAMEADTWMRHEGVPEKEIQKMHMEMDRFASRFVTDWEHRSYRAYMEEGQNDLQEMWNILDGHSPATMPNGSVWFSNAARQARQDLTRLEQDKARGLIGEQEYAEKRKEFRKTVKMYERLDALYHWVNQNVMASLPRPGSPNYSREVADVPRKVNAQMKQEIENVMTLVSSEKARGNLGKMDLIPAVRKRKLNENNPHDVLYMNFLDQIKNPAMAMVYNLDQQGKVLDKLTFNLQFGRSILQSGMGTIKGSREHVNLGVDNLSWMETGTLLRYIKVDPFFLDEIRHEQEIQLNLHDTVFGDIIQIIKQNFTILNWRMMVSNYLGNVSNLVATGHFFRFKNWMAGHAVGRDKFLSLFVQSSKKATNVLSGKKGAANVQQAMQDYEATIAEYKEEMEKLNIWGSGTTTIDLTRYGRGGIEKVSQLVSGILETTGMIDEVGSRAWNRRMNRGMNIARELYGFGDEWVKTLTYINNRAVAVAKYRAQENWARYAGNETSPAAVAANNRIMEMAKREAAILTMKETTTWELSPDFARQISASPIRVISPDFLLHSFQMARIMAVNVGRTRECAEEVARLRLKPSLTEDERLYLGLVTNELIRRTIGQSMMLWIGAEAASYGGSAIMGLLGSMLAFMRGEGDDDDERRKRKNRKKDDPAQMSPGDHTGLSMLCNYVSQVSDLYTPLMWVPGAVGDKFYALNFQRMNAALTLLPVRPAKLNPSFLERMEHIMWELIDLRSDTLSVQLANTLRGKDRYGNDLTKSEVFGEMVNYVVPQGLHQARNVALGIKDMVLGTEDIGWEERKRNRPLSIFDVAGVKVRQYSVNDMIEQVGRRISNLEREYENPYKRKFFQKLQRDLDMSDGDIAAAVSDIISVNKKEMERINYAMEAFRLLNIDRATLIRGFTRGRERNTPNLGNTETAFLLAGRDVLTERLKTNLQTKMKALQNPVEGSNMSDTERRKIMDNYRRAYRMISEALR